MTKKKTKTKKPVGFLLVDKPTDMTSHDVVNIVRSITDVRKVGHAGTLDPFATGLLIVGVSRGATKHMRKLVGLDKTYEAVFVLGATTETGDPETEIERSDIDRLPTIREIKTAMKTFLGDIKQVPSAHSAVKIRGRKMYEYARKGEKITVPARPVTIDTFEIVSKVREKDGLLHVPVRIVCSSGTYIRALARDLGQKLETGGYVQQLRRTAIGPFSIDEAVSVDRLRKGGATPHLQSVKAVLGRL